MACVKIDTSDIEQVLDAAQRHGEQSEPDHEVGDLQEIVRALWAMLSPEQRDAAWTTEDWYSYLELWPERA